MNDTHQLEVKKGAVARTMKDYGIYQKELHEAQSKYDSIKDSGDDHEIKRAKDVLLEAKAVLNDTRKRLTAFAIDLDQFIRVAILPAIKDSKTSPACKAMFKECKACLDELSQMHPEIEFKPTQKTD